VKNTTWECRAALCELFVSWALRIAPKDYVPSFVKAIAEHSGTWVSDKEWWSDPVKPRKPRFDRNTYMREYMRKRRAKKNDPTKPTERGSLAHDPSAV
jgi:hypothetical protein